MKTITNLIILFCALSLKAQIYTPAGVIQGTSGNNNVGIGTTSPSAKLHINNGDNSYGAILANANEVSFSLYTKTISTQPIMSESFRLGLKYNNDENNGFISFYRGSSTNGGFLGFSTSGIERVRILNNGNLGIGTPSPTGSLEIKSPALTGNSETLLKLSVSDAAQDYIKISNGTLTDGQFVPTIQGHRASDGRASLYVTASTEANLDYGSYPLMTFDARTSTAAVATRPLFSWDSYGNRKMTLNANGGLGIGTATTGAHKLAVEGSIGAREVKVTASGWADFVFKKEYNLPTLEEVEKHIKEKGHLENIPNEEEVLQNGINLGEMNVKLLQKIEELTLYIIEMKKESEKQREEIAILKNKIL